MAEDGDTLLLYGGASPLPLMFGWENSGVGLSFVRYLAGRVIEFGWNPSYDWASSPVHNEIFDITNIILNIDPVHTYDTPVWSHPIGGNPQYFRINVPFTGGDLDIDIYTWSLTMDIRHNTFFNGVVTRSYTTIGQANTLFTDPDPVFVPEIIMDFSTGPPSKPINPTPTDTDTGIVLATDEVNWEDGGGTDDYDVYFGPTGDVTLRSSAQVGITWTIPIDTLVYGIVYQWYAVANNAFGFTVGDTWAFTTLFFAPPYASGDDPSGDGTPGDDGGEYGGEGGKNLVRTVRRLLAAASNKIYYEDK
ncbi:hypothetical protein LCGC14_2517600 [marine sediment metagenome]|uniref:Fibronectin type-III domain-containing protein n=1 Tax=marine sediment metagenome TaxID=412755 RepID=A0A0F9D908_9ZZZZ